ncbi:hypothetical protein [Nocardia sp. XZ_19_385]|uniref:hypothetical protein n=1 Tax=Nocardia sp. XZ_19_385 TaxID=2769488 RepID=UPI00281569A0|nr:hypothetical protein [Nocardia sp. XZ_19_385]
MDEAKYRETRESLHGIAELLIAGPQYREFGTIRLRVVLGGFGGAKLAVSVLGTGLVGPGGGRVPLEGTYNQIAKAAGIGPGAPEGLYADTTGRQLDDEVHVDPEAAAIIGDWFATGDAALRCLAPDVTPVLWPEHFDLASSRAEVNFGVSPGDAGHPAPYAYVGPWTPRTGEFWNAPFGALRPREELRTASSLLAFFEEGRARAEEG